MNAEKGAVVPTIVNFDAFESRLESCDALFAASLESSDRLKGHIVDCLESSAKVTAAAKKAAGICETLVKKAPERHRLYIAAVNAARRPANKQLSTAELVRQVRANLAHQ